MIKQTLTPIALAAVMVAAGCGPNGAPAGGGSNTADLAQPISKNTYQNKPFGITITAPDGWYVADNEMTRQIMDVGKQLTTDGQNAQTKAAMEASLARSSNLFTFLKHAPGTPVDSNPGILGISEDVSVAPGVERGSDYFFHMRKTLDASGADYDVVGDYETRKIGGQDFDRLEIVLRTMGAAASQRYYAARHGKDMVVFIQSYNAPEDLAALDGVLDSVELDW
jgi:hypothetical protein